MMIMMMMITLPVVDQMLIRCRLHSRLGFKTCLTKTKTQDSRLTRPILGVHDSGTMTMTMGVHDWDGL